MIPYILHVSILITAGFLFYKLLLKKLTFYALNRWILLSCLMVAFVLPLLPIPRQWSWRERIAGQAPEVADVPLMVIGDTGAVTKPTVRTVDMSTVRTADMSGGEAEQKPAIMSTTGSDHRSATTSTTGPHYLSATVSKNGPDLKPAAVGKTDAGRVLPVGARPAATATAPVAGNFDLVKRIIPGLFYLYLFGVIVLGVNMLRQLISLLVQGYRGPVIRDGKFRIITTAGMHGPCSFGNIIFIHPQQYDPETYQQILLHEKVHAGGWHTLDIILAELGIIFQWFNPFIWMYRREMENNLEFLTDRHVLQYPGVERSAYQLSLVKVAAPDMPLSITSNYNQSLLKRRIIMMNATTSTRHAAWKYFFLLPLFIFLAGILNRPALLAQSSKPKKVHAPAVPATPSTIAVPPAVAMTPSVPADVPTVQALASTEPLPAAAPTVEVQPAVAPVPVVVPPVPPVDTVKPSSRASRMEGAWFITNYKQDDKDNKVRIELRDQDDDHQWNSSFSVDRSKLSLSAVGKVEFALTREAGTMHFSGQFDGEQGFGHYKFEPDANYFAFMRQKKIVIEEDELLSFFQLDIRKDYVAMVQANGFPDISKNHLISMAALGVDEAYIKGVREMGYTDITENHLITFKALKIDKDFINDVRKAGYDHLPVEKLITFKSLKIDGTYLRSFPAGTPPEDVVTYKSLRIDSEYLASIKKEGYTDISSRDIVAMKSLHVTPEYIRGFHAIGYKEIPVQNLISLKSLGVTPEYVKGFQEVGLTDIPPNHLNTLKSMGITVDYVKGFIALGYKDIDVNHLASLKSMGITPEFIKEFNAIGFKNIPLNQLTSLKAMGVTPSYVSKMKEKGFVSEDLNRYIRLKNAFD